MEAIVESVSMNPEHTFSKQRKSSIRLIKNVGVEGDAHSGRMCSTFRARRQTLQSLI